MKGLKCTCGKIAEYKEHLKFNQFDISGWVCSCGEVYYDPVKAEKILRIPKEVSDILEIGKGDKVELGLLDKNRLVISI